MIGKYKSFAVQEVCIGENVPTFSSMAEAAGHDMPYSRPKAQFFPIRRLADGKYGVLAVNRII